jgi:Arc/MetJ family transcription regulator
MCINTVMRTNIEIDDELLSRVLELSNAKTKKEAIENALKEYLRILSQKQLLSLRGEVKWEGNLDDMRSL